jgi:hypothetical protein
MSERESAFDGVLARTGNVSSAMTRGKQIVTERAREDAPDEFCRACVNSTPLAYENASDHGTVALVNATGEAVAARIEEVGGDLTDRWWIKADLQDAYVDAFCDACADPSECEVCSNPDAYENCGHDRFGQVCPARGGETA